MKFYIKESNLIICSEIPPIIVKIVRYQWLQPYCFFSHLNLLLFKQQFSKLNCRIVCIDKRNVIDNQKSILHDITYMFNGNPQSIFVLEISHK